MTGQSRRQFIKSALFLFFSGLTTGLGRLRVRGEELRESMSSSKKFHHKEELRAGVEALTDKGFEPVYLKLLNSGELRGRGQELWEVMRRCRLCPRECGVNRLDGDKGFCQASSQLMISSYRPHFGEEKPLVGKGGSGTIFLTHCGLRCVFCINWQISQAGHGYPRSIEEMAKMMLILQERGCHNINVVTPTHYAPHIVLAVEKAASGGLRLPIVYNTCGWERLEVLKKLDGIIDIYLPDFKYSDDKMAAKYSSGAETYTEVTKEALLEMNRQVGQAKPASDGLIYRGLMVRHLIMPNGVGGTKEVIGWIAKHLPKDTYLNIMSQYMPMYKAYDYKEIRGEISREEYEEAIGWAREAGLTNLDSEGWRPVRVWF